MTHTAYELGLVSISFRKHTPREILEAARAAGLTCIEWGSDVHAPCGDLERLREIARLQEAYGIRCSSYGTYFRLGQTPVAELADYIAAARVLGTDILRLWGGAHNLRDMTEEEKARFMADARAAAQMAEEAGVTLCLECHHDTVTQYPEDGVAVLEEVGSPALRSYWQPFQWLEPGGSLAVARVLAPYTTHVHVFNWKGAAKLPLREATEAWRDYLSVLPPPRALLLEFMPDDRIESLPAEAEALRTIVGGSL